MTAPRLTSAIRASALIRLAEAAGGFAIVVAKGDSTSGQILIQTLEKGVFSGLYEPLLDAAGGYRWQPCGPQAVENKGEIDAYLARRRAQDRDLWIIELDVPEVSRFIVEQASAT